MTKGPPDLTKFGEGYSKLEKYLTGELYAGIDGLVNEFSGKIPKENYSEIEKAHKAYKSGIEALKKELDKSIKGIDALVERAKKVKTNEELAVLQKKINERYQVTFQSGIELYGLLEPAIDISGLGKFYTDGLKDDKGKAIIKGLDKKLFQKGSGLIKDYFIDDKEIEKAIKGAAGQKHKSVHEPGDLADESEHLLAA